MLRSARKEGRGVELPELMQTDFANYRGRIWELRQLGFVIENELWNGENGRRHSRYWLIYDPEQDAQ